MKPSFALNFTDDAIQLLHRTSKGWVPVAETPFAAPDLDEALDYMRKTALGLEPGGFTTKLVIPNSQIRYLEIEAPGPDDDSRRAQIAAALESQTPLRADEIAFDWSGRGKMVKVAALAKDTLAEAEGFATAHRFNPVGFVAIPEDGTFSGEPWFGETEAAFQILDGAPIERDKGAIRILQRELPPRAAEPVAAAPVAEAPAAAEPVAAEPEPEPEPIPAPAPETLDPVSAPPEPEPAPLAETEIAAPVAAAPEDLPPLPEVAAEPVMAEPAIAEEAPFTHVAENPAFPEDEVAPVAAAGAGVTEPLIDPSVEDDIPPAPPNAAMVAFASRRSPEAARTAPPLGAAVKTDALAQMRAARGKPIEDLPPIARPPQAGALPSTGTGLKGQVAKGLGALVTAPSIPGAKKAKGKVLPAAAPAAAPRDRVEAATTPAAAAKSLTRPGGTFGGRPAPQRKSRVGLFFSLVAILLLCLALLAAWSSFYLASRGDDTDPTAVAAASPDGEPLPAIEDEMAADGEDPALIEDATAETAVAEPVAEEPAVAPEAAETAEAAVEPVAEPAPEPAPTGVAASEDPTAPAAPTQQDEIFLAAADSPPPALDALSLPAPDAAADALPQTPMPPPPFGTVYAFDDQGLLIPTPEGIVSPAGVLLIAGKPPRVPPPRSETATAAAAAAEAEAAAALVAAAPVDETVPAEAGAVVEAQPVPTAPEAQPNPELADRRPKARPEGLAPNPDDAALEAGDGAVQAASLRPRARPPTVLAAGEQARQETEAASLAATAAAETEAQLAAAAAAEAENPSVVAISRRPAQRPKDFSRAVEAAVAAAIRTPEPPPEEPAAEPEATAKAEPAPDIKPEEQDEIDEPEVASSAAPKVPTKASVAKQATFKNALNLSKTNLIGVYGTQSKRYALVRLSSGKYKKVKVGDRIDGGRVEAITQTEVRYVKGGKLVTLKMPKG